MSRFFSLLLEEGSLTDEGEANKAALLNDHYVQLIDSETLVCLRCFKNIDLEGTYNIDNWYRHQRHCHKIKALVGVSDTPLAFVIDECTIKCAQPGCKKTIKLQDKRWKAHFRDCRSEIGAVGAIFGHIHAKCLRCQSRRISLRCKPWRDHLHRFHGSLNLHPVSLTRSETTPISDGNKPLAFVNDTTFTATKANVSSAFISTYPNMQFKLTQTYLETGLEEMPAVCLETNYCLADDIPTTYEEALIPKWAHNISGFPPLGDHVALNQWHVCDLELPFTQTYAEVPVQEVTSQDWSGTSWLLDIQQRSSFLWTPSASAFMYNMETPITYLHPYADWPAAEQDGVNSLWFDDWHQ